MTCMFFVSVRFRSIGLYTPQPIVNPNTQQQQPAQPAQQPVTEQPAQPLSARERLFGSTQLKRPV
jgi:hypothetical protein